MKVLIVDDDPFMVEMYALKLKAAGFDVDSAADGKSGLGKIQAGGLDAVLLDIVLPVMDGFEVLAALRRSGRHAPPILLLTNLGQKEDVERGLSLGAAGYAIKAQFTPSEIVEKVNALIGKVPHHRAAKDER